MFIRGPCRRMEVLSGPARVHTRPQGTMASALVRDSYVMFVRGPCGRMEVHSGPARVRTQLQGTMASDLIRGSYVMFVHGPCRHMEVHSGPACARTRPQGTIAMAEGEDGEKVHSHFHWHGSRAVAENRIASNLAIRMCSPSAKYSHHLFRAQNPWDLDYLV